MAGAVAEFTDQNFQSEVIGGPPALCWSTFGPLGAALAG